MRAAGCMAILLVAMAAGVSAQTSQKPKKFLGGPLVIEDQGSFFVGGVQKVTDYAVVPPPPAPGRRRRRRLRRRSRSPSARCTCSSRFRPKKYGGGLAGDHGARLDAHRRLPRVDARRPRRLVSVLRPQGRAELRRRSGRTRPLRLRPVGAPRRRSAPGARRRRRRRPS